MSESEQRTPPKVLKSKILHKLKSKKNRKDMKFILKFLKVRKLTIMKCFQTKATEVLAFYHILTISSQ